MSQTFFSKLGPEEKTSRLELLASSRGEVTLWVKGQKEKQILIADDFDNDRFEIVLNSQQNIFPENSQLLCSFVLRGMNFFSQVNLVKSVKGYNLIQFKGDLFKSERRSSYRLLTYPIYDVWCEFHLGEAYDGEKVISIKSKASDATLFNNFLRLVDDKNEEGPVASSNLKFRVQDLSATGMGIHVGESEAKFFIKDMLFKNVDIKFIDEQIIIPEVKVVYAVDYISGDRNLKKFKIGLHFPNLPTTIDEQIARKINKLLREIDFNKDFENFIK